MLQRSQYDEPVKYLPWMQSGGAGMLVLCALILMPAPPAVSQTQVPDSPYLRRHEPDVRLDASAKVTTSNDQLVPDPDPFTNPPQPEAQAERVYRHVVQTILAPSLTEVALQYRKMTPRERRRLTAKLESERQAAMPPAPPAGPITCTPLPATDIPDANGRIVRTLPAVTTEPARLLPPATIELTVKRSSRLQELPPLPGKK